MEGKGMRRVIFFWPLDTGDGGARDEKCLCIFLIIVVFFLVVLVIFATILYITYSQFTLHLYQR